MYTRTCAFVCCISVAMAAISVSRVRADCTPEWSQMEGVAGLPSNTWVNPNGLSVWSPPGGGPDLLVAAGLFTSAGGIAANNIAAWDGARWYSLGGGTSGTHPDAIAVTSYDGDLIAAGSFTAAGGVPANSIAKWDGTAWTPLGGGLTDPASPPFVLSAAAYNGELYAGGWFGYADGQPTGDFVKWDGTHWARVSFGGIHPGTVHALIEYQGELAAASTSGVWKWNGSRWVHLGGQYAVGYAYALAVYNGDLIAGGSNLSTGASSYANVVRWDGTTWTALGGGTDGTVNGLCVYGGELIATGYFTNAGGVPASRVAKWNGAHWAPLASGIGGLVAFAAVEFRGDLIVGGNFASAGGVPMSNLARWGCPRAAGDLNCDGLVNNGDVDAFIMALTDSVSYVTTYPTCDITAGDVNGDGLINNGDIDAFVALVTGG